MNNQKISKLSNLARKSGKVVSHVLLSLYVLPYMARKYLDEHTSIVPKVSEDSLIALRAITGSVIGPVFTWGIHTAYNYGRLHELKEPTGLELLVYGGLGSIGNVASGIYEIYRNERINHKKTRAQSARREEYANLVHRADRVTTSMYLDKQLEEIENLPVTGPDRDADGKLL